LTNNGTTTTTKKYYAIAGQTVAMDDGSGLKYLLADHLGSTVGVTDSDGELISQQRYLPFGEIRNVGVSITQTDFGYTGQRNLPDTGLMDYKTRMYDPYLKRFIQPDTIVPGAGNPQSWNKYTYANNSPVLYSDPSGHFPWFYLFLGLYVIGTQVIDQISDYNAWESKQEPYIPQPTGYPTNTGTPKPLSIQALPTETPTPSPTSTPTKKTLM
jgi:RHS repeat-associated protein